MKKLLSMIMLICALFMFIPSVMADGFTPEDVTTPYFILMDADTKEVYYENGSTDKFYPASTTKILTCILAIENTEDLDAIITVPSVTDRGSVMGIREGEQISMRDLLYGLMLVSGNDAAEAIAKTVSGTVDSFAVLMNAKAIELGMVNSHFVNPNGLHNEEHYSTAYDMGLLAAYAMQNEIFREIVATKEYTTSPTNYAPDGHELVNTNRLVNTPEGKKNLEYAYATGIKTGNTIPAGYCLVASATKDDTDLIVVILGDPEGYVPSELRFENAAKLFDRGFVNITTIDASSLSIQSEFVVDVNNASFDDPEYGKLTLRADMSGFSMKGLKTDLDAIISNPTLIEYEMDVPTLVAPIRTGMVVGTVTYKYEGNVIYTADLVALRDVAEMQEPVPSINDIEISAPEPADEPASYLFLWILLAVLVIALLIVVYMLLTGRGLVRRRKKYGNKRRYR